MIEKDFNIPFVAQLAQREKQIQQSYRPIIGVHKWFARRPGALFRALLLTEFVKDQPLIESYFHSQDLGRLIIGDPFIGGGTPLIEASRVGCHVVGTDINPMAYWVVKQELADLDLPAFRSTAKHVTSNVEKKIGHLYETTCTYCGYSHAPVKYFLWVKQQRCTKCSETIDLFSNYVLAKNQRHPNYVIICPRCRALNEIGDLKTDLKTCHACGEKLITQEPGGRNHVLCRHCGYKNHYPPQHGSPPSHELFALEYHCPHCNSHHQGRFFKPPDSADRERFRQAQQALDNAPKNYIPTECIPAGDETNRLHRWGYTHYAQLFNARQRLGLQTLASEIAMVDDETIRHALLTVFSDTLRYQNMLCRYDSYALKIIDIFSVHGFPVSTTQCENSLLGIPNIGSGGFRHFVSKYHRAKSYGETPFEKSLKTKKKIYLAGETINTRLINHYPIAPPTQSPSQGGKKTNGPVKDTKSAYIQAVSATDMTLPENYLDAVLTDPPYFANIQYAELMDFCYVWLRKHLVEIEPAFQSLSTRAAQELTVNETEGRGIEQFTTGLSQIFVNFARALKPGAPFAFTYHHNDPQAYLPIAIALLDAGLVCTTTLPCPAEMGASIHINGTKSSVIDSVFVCRSTGTIQACDFEKSPNALERMLQDDITALDKTGHEATSGDIHCILLGHLTRLAIWQLRSNWIASNTITKKLGKVRQTLNEIYPLDLVSKLVNQVLVKTEEMPLLAYMITQEKREPYASQEIPF